MTLRLPSWVLNRVSGALPWLLLFAIVVVFGSLSDRFLTVTNLTAIVTQSCWLIIVALGMNFVLLSSGVDLSVGAVMYLAAAVIGTALFGTPWWVGLPVVVLMGSAVGVVNGIFIAKFRLPSFVVTLATAFMVKGLALYLSSTKIVFAGQAIASLGRSKVIGVSVPSIFASIAFCCAWLLLQGTSLGLYVRSIGADAEGAQKAGVPRSAVMWIVFALCGGFAGFAGFVLMSQTSAASAGFAQNVEFLAIAAAVLGGTSLFGGRGTVSAPLLGAILITTVQNGLAVVNANPYVYPVIVGGVIFLAALLDSVRLYLSLLAKRRKAVELAERQRISSAGELLDNAAHN